MTEKIMIDVCADNATVAMLSLKLDKNLLNSALIPVLGQAARKTPEKLVTAILSSDAQSKKLISINKRLRHLPLYLLRINFPRNDLPWLTTWNLPDKGESWMGKSATSVSSACQTKALNANLIYDDALLDFQGWLVRQKGLL